METVETLKLIVSLLGVIVAAGAASFGLWQYRHNQIWRETEFVAEQTKDFFAEPNVVKALKILDWEKRNIDLGQPAPTLVNREMLRKALAHGEDAKIFKHEEAAIRDIFDTFFTRLEQFEQFIKAEVIRFEHVAPYFRYWAGLLHGERPQILDLQTIAVVWKFMHHYGYSDAVDLLIRFPKRPPAEGA